MSVTHDHGFELHADRGRRMVRMDPGGREMVITCGAALFNVRVAAFLQVIDSSEKVETVTDLVRSAEQADRADFWHRFHTQPLEHPELRGELRRNAHAARRRRY
ncbi:hypothetical protein ABZZ74_41435 [Streptomyces sp. NPDC006476]|uniref:hypothetical protein n=1 Tax=Streptomyces sp. NPDC006476 TaxID=3157175 RepID=UPI0033A9B1A2